MSNCLSWVAFLGLGLLVLAGAADVALAEDAPEGTIELEARLEPADLRPGQDGFLVVQATIEHELHVYAEEGQAKLEWKPIPAEGVEYHVPATPMSWDVFEKTPGAVTWTKPILFQDPNYSPEELPPFPVWLPAHPFTLRVPVTLSESAAPGTQIGLAFDYSACDELMCFDRVRGQRAVAVLGAASKARGWKSPAPAKNEHVEITVAHDAEKGEVVVVFEPAFGFYVSMPGTEEGVPVEVVPLEDEGVTWGEVRFADEGAKVHAGETFEARVPVEFSDDAERLRLKIQWQACSEEGNCFRPDETVFVLVREGAREVPPVVPVEPEGPDATDPKTTQDPVVEVQPGEKLLVLGGETIPYGRVYGDDLDQPRADKDWKVVDASMAPVPTSEFEKLWQKGWLIALGGIFVLGVGLSFTPCVLPIIPLTISVIGGGAAGKVSRGRLSVMLTAYVLGLAATYGVAGAVSGMLGKAIDLEMFFRIPAFVWGLAIFFLAMGAAMLGIFEMQPPAWMERIRGGAAQKGGTLLGSFLLGCVAALIASPCTGPFVVAMLAFVAKVGNPALGFLIFFTLGLGMGAVFFAAGSLNLLAKPGPWMVWVRYTFGVILFGVALYFLANAGAIGGVTVFIMGFGIAILAWLGVARHLIKKEGERPGVAQKRGAGLAVAIILVTGVVAHLTDHPAPVTVDAANAGKNEGWVKITKLEDLKKNLERATSEGRPAVVDVWAITCHNCKLFDKVIEGDAYLREAFGKFVCLKLDESDEDLDPLREHVGLPTSGQPRMAFFDEQGRIRKAAEIERWFGKEGEDANRELRRRVDFILKRTKN